MKNKAIIFIFLALILGFQVNADVWRVNNRTILNKTVDADFTTLQAAINGASANDTIYIEGSPTSYGDGTFDKPLVVIGTGYFLTDNDTTQAYQQGSQVGKLIFNAGSEGSVVMGLYSFVSAGVVATVSCVNINTDSITLKKNRIYAINTSWSYDECDAYSIIVAAGIQDVVISQNFISSTTTRSHALSIGLKIGTGAKCIVNNNIMYNSLDNPDYDFGVLVGSDVTNEIYINNNVFYNYALQSYYTTYLNNIQIGGAYTIGTGDNSANNLCDGTQFPLNGNSNQQGVDMSTVFVDYTSTVDSGYVLKPAPNPAIGAGINGGDCGVFSYDTGFSYVLSGLPEIPANFSFTMTSDLGVGSIPVNIKSITHNEGK